MHKSSFFAVMLSLYCLVIASGTIFVTGIYKRQRSTSYCSLIFPVDQADVGANQELPYRNRDRILPCMYANQRRCQPLRYWFAVSTDSIVNNRIGTDRKKAIRQSIRTSRAATTPSISNNGEK